MNIFVLKLIAIGLVFLTGVSSGIFPLKFRVGGTDRLFFSLGNSLAGGVFLGVGLLHLLPDGIKHLSGVSAYPIAMLLAALSLGVLLYLEKVLFIEGEGRELEHLGKKPAFYPYLLAIVLSIHSFIAGVALGIESTILGSIVLFIAIIAHKGSAAFSLAINMMRGGILKSTHLRVILLFSCMTPIGILLGSGLASAFESNTSDLIEGVFDSLAAGTFIYVSVLDIIEEEFSIPGNEALKFLAIITGLSLMALLAVWT